MSADALNQRFIYVPRRALVVSLVLHVLIPVFIIVAQAFNLFELLSRRETSPYQNFIQVDVVDLPDQTERKAVDTSLPITETPQQKTTPEDTEKTMALPEASKPKQPDASALRKQRDEAMKHLRSEAKREAAINALLAAKAAKAGRQKLAGNILSQGTSASGKLGSASDRYKALVTQAIREHFNVYAWQKKKGLLAVITIERYPNGKVREKHFDKVSSDSLYNSAVMQAIDEAEPLPMPDDLSLLNEPITISLRPED